jgi:hypothetical protein
MRVRGWPLEGLCGGGVFVAPPLVLESFVDGLDLCYAVLDGGLCECADGA